MLVTRPGQRGLTFLKVVARPSLEGVLDNQPDKELTDRGFRTFYKFGSPPQR